MSLIDLNTPALRRHLAAISIGGTLTLASMGAAAAPSATYIPPAACDGPYATVLHASAAIDARAYWLNRQLIKWPGADAGARFKLYYSAQAAITSARGAKVGGADGALTLTAYNSAIPAEMAQRFKFTGNGPLLAVGAADSDRLAQLHQQQMVLAAEAADGTVLDATAIQLAGALDDIYASAAKATDLGATVGKAGTQFKLWAPTAQRVAVCTYASGDAKAGAIAAMRFDAGVGVEAHRRDGAGLGVAAGVGADRDSLRGGRPQLELRAGLADGGAEVCRLGGAGVYVVQRAGQLEAGARIGAGPFDQLAVEPIGARVDRGRSVQYGGVGAVASGWRDIGCGRGGGRAHAGQRQRAADRDRGQMPPQGGGV